MTSPSEFYVYVHRDKAGNVFYIGKGCGERAWSTDRHDVWHRYVTERLSGEYDVEILQRNMTEAAAEELEDELILSHGSQLVNWINPGRQFDYEALAQFHTRRDKNRQFVAETRVLERSDLDQAIECYGRALEEMYGYMGLTLERGLVAELSNQFSVGDHDILDRLTLCLNKAGRYSETLTAADRYFATFPNARNLAAGQTILRRVDRARASAQPTAT